MTDISDPEIVIDCFLINFDAVFSQILFEPVEKFVQRCLAAKGNIVNFIFGLWSSGCCQKICLYCIVDIAEVPAGFSVAVNFDLFVL